MATVVYTFEVFFRESGAAPWFVKSFDAAAGGRDAAYQYAGYCNSFRRAAGGSGEYSVETAAEVLA